MHYPVIWSDNVFNQILCFIGPADLGALIAVIRPLAPLLKTSWETITALNADVSRNAPYLLLPSVASREFQEMVGLPHPPPQRPYRTIRQSLAEEQLKETKIIEVLDHMQANRDTLTYESAS